MTDDRQRGLDQANKLIRMACPSGGATEPERANAALRAAELVDKHNLAFALVHRVRKDDGTGRGDVLTKESFRSIAKEFVDSIFHAAANAAGNGSEWIEARAPAVCQCFQCGKRIKHLDIAWLEPGTGNISHVKCFEEETPP